ncbi:Microtubule-associated protein futsch [Pseudolycoriella hygida]|uniref:Microtubule-associated protein futsch n=1 Tax=Pseudolycoriella hygida TaxID=35572 RepID=A0A9Q0RSW8_9DIPT|nr:Microtubule-associated protein futsch [Pseudolycoriella hygida]
MNLQLGVTWLVPKKLSSNFYFDSSATQMKSSYLSDRSYKVTIIPTYDTDVLGYWVSENEDLLAKYHIDLSPSASRCTINLQDHETSCSAYRLEF